MAGTSVVVSAAAAAASVVCVAQHARQHRSSVWLVVVERSVEER